MLIGIGIGFASAFGFLGLLGWIDARRPTSADHARRAAYDQPLARFRRFTQRQPIEIAPESPVPAKLVETV